MSGIPCSCEASDARVCYLIKWGEVDGKCPRCSCGCHAAETVREVRCFYCGKLFRTVERRDDHQAWCAECFFEDGREPYPPEGNFDESEGNSGRDRDGANGGNRKQEP